jgi:hypothetical protein
MGDYVVQFIGEARALLATVGADLGTAPEDAIPSLLGGAHSGEMPYRGRTTSGVSYHVHGAGCRFVLPNRSEVDLDIIVRDGRPGFDAWRVQQWANSVSRGALTKDEVANEASELVRAGVLYSVRDGWWTWIAPRSGDIAAR